MPGQCKNLRSILGRLLNCWGILTLMNYHKTLDVLVERAISNPTITIRSECLGDHAVVTVSDNAGGVCDGAIGRVFDPHFTTKPKGKGSGIGLHMSKTIIEEHMGGRLTVANVGEGAEFRIEVKLDMCLPDRSSLV